MNKNTFLSKLILSSFSKLFSSVGLITFNIIIIYYTNKDTLGILTLGISLVTFLSIFCKFGLNHATLRLSSIFFEKKDLIKINQIILTALILSGIISLFLSFLIFYFEQELAINIYKNEDVKGVLKIFAISLPFFTFIQIQKSLLKSFKLPALANFSDIGSILFLGSIMVIFFQIIEINLNIYRISLFFLVSCLITFSINNFILFNTVISNFNNFEKRGGDFFLEFNNSFLKSLRDYFSIDFVNYVLVWGSIFICTFFYDVTTIASFSSTFWLAYSILFFPLVLNSIFAPDYAIDSFENKKQSLKISFYKNRNISLLITLPFFLILFVFGDFVISTIFEINDSNFINIFRILLLNSLLRIIFGPQVLFLNMTDKQNIVRRITISIAILQVFLIFYAASYYNLLVLSYVFILTNLLKHLILYKELKKYLKII
tara:strand:+ start:168 stop:1460 length:1293 start_codon:yes stop_codon:yes gene_type:complete